MTLVRFNPVKELLNVEREFGKLFRDFEGRFGFGGDKSLGDEYENAVWMPLTDVLEDKDNYTLYLDLPGIKKDEVKISYTEGRLIISGERKQGTVSGDKNFHRVERTYGKFFRSFDLPQRIKEDKISANFSDGQLTIQIPKADEAKPREIAISVK